MRDGNYRIGDLVDGRSLRWSTTDISSDASVPFLIPIAREGRVIGFVKSEVFAAPNPGPADNETVDGYAATEIVDETGRSIGHFEKGVPVLDSDR